MRSITVCVYSQDVSMASEAAEIVNVLWMMAADDDCGKLTPCSHENH